MRLPEIHDWTIVRLSFALEDRVVINYAVSGHARHRAGFRDGSLFLTSNVQKIEIPGHILTTRNTTYLLRGPAVPLEDWDEERYQTIWWIGNHGSGLLSSLEGVTDSPAELNEMVFDPAFVARHLAQRRLLSAIDMASDIDNGLGKADESPDVSLLGALDNIAKRTASIDRAVALAHRMRLVELNELGGVEPVIRHPGFPPALTLMVDDVAQAPMRLIPIAEIAGTIAAHLPEKLKPWARCAWFIAKNPNLPDCETPVAAIEKGQVEEAARAAKAFPRMETIRH